MKYSYNMMMYLMTPMLLSMFMHYNNLFISLEIPLIYMSSFNIPVSILLDWVSLMFLTTVMFISSMIIMFSMYYIPKSEYSQFIILLLMFVLSMAILIISDNIIFILLGWDGLGLSSYALVIYYQNYSSSASGSITILSNRVGDIMILLTISIMMMNSNWNFNMNKEFNLISLLLLLIAASSKSAQFPFSAWLPAAMAAPTPISALVHSSTLVTAGVFLLIRTMNNIHPVSMMTLMTISSATALYAGMAANWEQDMKKIIALSTLSQIAMMMFALSMKSMLLAFFHLVSHALFKSTMFLCAGIMIHNSSYQDMRMMSMNAYNTPTTHTILGVSSLALMGIPFMSGFFSKDAIIETMLNSYLTSIMSICMISSIGMTATYTIRMSLLSNTQTIKSKPDTLDHHSPHANTPILLMAPMSILLGGMLLWIISPQQMFLLSQQMKMTILLALFSGALLGLTMSFKKKLFNKMGESSIALWFIHFISASPMTTLSPLMMTSAKNDKSWQEMYGPYGLFTLTNMASKIPNKMKLALLFTLMLMLIMPAIT